MHTQRQIWIAIAWILLPLAIHAQQNIVLIYAHSQLRGNIYLLQEKADAYYVKNVFPCRFGYNGINKRQRGDGKTPLGHYKILEERPKSLKSSRQLNEFGGYFLLIDYPNYCDKRNGRTGGAIGLHGGKNNITQGCIRVLDAGTPRISRYAIREIAAFTKYGTDVIITDRLSDDLIERRGRMLSASASAYWKELISRRRCYSEIVRGQGSQKILASKEPDPNIIYLGTLKNSRGASSIRKDKDGDSPSIGTVRGGETFVYLREDKDWYTVISQEGVQGYIHRSRIQSLCTAPSGTAQINDPDGYTNLRSAPSSSSTVIRRITEEEVFFYKEVNSSWWEVVTRRGIKGYMHQSRIQTVMEE